MPRPTAAGRFGIAGTIARACGSFAEILAMVLPARIETTSVLGPAKETSEAAASSRLCGLIASTRTCGGREGASNAKPLARASSMGSGGGCGSMTLIFRGSQPRSSQARNRAPPILPAPARRRDMLTASASMSGPALRFEHDRGERLGPGFASPDDKLKRLVIAFAGGHRAGENGLTLMAVQLGTAGEQNGMPEHDHAVFRPNVEMPDPKLFIDERDKRGKIHEARRRNLEVEGAGDMQGLHIGEPGEGDIVIGPAAGDRDRNFVLFVAVEGPMIMRGDALDDIDRVFAAIEVELQKRHSRASDGSSGNREMHPHFRWLVVCAGARLKNHF